MNRRAFFIGLGAVLTAPLRAEAQPAGKMVRLGRLSLSGTADLRAVKSADAPAGHGSDAIVDGLRELGYVEGRDFLLERRDANGVANELPKLAEELVRIPVDILLVTGVTATAAARRATQTIPIVCMVGDPVGQGFVKSLARPGANITGVTLAPGGTDLGGKFLQLLRDVVPSISRVGFLRSANNPSTPPAVFFPATGPLGMRLVTVEIHNAAGFDRAFDTLIYEKVQAITSDGDPLTDAEASRIVEFAMRQRLPGMFPRRSFVEDGGLMSYGPSLYLTWKRAAVHVDKILRGAKPADLPVERPTKFEFVINLKTAKALGLTIPPSLLLRADQVIE
jgi:putative tryptophan/tyrosine transport system substrate-binding protein